MRGDLREARRYIALAASLGGNAAPRERGLIEALAVRYGEQRSLPQDAPLLAEICSTPSSDEKADPLDGAYAARLRVLAEAHPGDADIASLYAEAVMVATRSDWWDRKSGKPAGAIADMVQRLETALAKTPEHIGVNHYLIHALDASPHPERAVAAADRLGTLAPASPHLVHMPAHIYARVSRFADVVRVNEEAVAAQASLGALLSQQAFAKTADWDGHNLHFLWFGAVMEGRGDLALATARRIATRGASSTSGFAQYRRALPIHTLARFERWGAVLAEPPSADTGFTARTLDGHARALALLHTGQREAARALQSEIAQLKPPQGKEDGAELLRSMHGILLSRLSAELAQADGRTEAAIAAAQAAVAAEDAFEAREPPMLAAMSRQAQGQLLLSAGRALEAEVAFRADLAEQPGSGWALRGLHAALQRQGKSAEAAGVLEQLQRAWRAADPALRPASAG
jgi:tetratricopeptide (TPR) repeat protein